MAWGKETFEKAKASVQEFEQENQEKMPYEYDIPYDAPPDYPPFPDYPIPPDYPENYPENYPEENQEFLEKPSEIVLARICIEHIYGDQSWDDLKAISQKDGKFILFELDGYNNSERQTELSEQEVLNLITQYDMVLSDEGEKQFGEQLRQQAQAKESPTVSEQIESHAVPVEMVAKNAEGKEIPITKPIDFEKMLIERYGVTDKDCYTLHPKRDVLEEIFNRISAVEVTFSGFEPDAIVKLEQEGECLLYVNTDENQSFADLRFASLDDGIDVSVPITEEEAKKAQEAVAAYEANRDKPKEQASEKAEPSKKEHSVPEKE